MSFSGPARRAMSSAARHTIDWSAPVFKGTPELMAAVNQFRGWVAGAEAMAEKYKSEPAPIDFAAAKKEVRDKDLVAALEKMYTSSSPPPETYEWSAEDMADKKLQIEEAKGRQAFIQETIEETAREIAFMKANRTTRDTSATELKENYPEIAEEIETELENREWFKDTIQK